MIKLLLLIGTLLTTVSFVPYLRDIVRHGARPRLISWVIWTVLLGLMASVSYQEHQWASAVVATVSAVGCAVVVVLGRRYATRDITKLEKAAVVGTALGVALWLAVDSPIFALLAALAADCLAYVPTLVHGWTEPDEESWHAYGIGAVGESLILVVALAQHASWLGLAYPLYAAVFGLTMTAIILVRRWWYRAGDDAVYELY